MVANRYKEKMTGYECYASVRMLPTNMMNVYPLSAIEQYDKCCNGAGLSDFVRSHHHTSRKTLDKQKKKTYIMLFWEKKKTKNMIILQENHSQYHNTAMFWKHHFSEN